ncbi:MAG: efflux RND transporter periplasmic adaptor subunit [Thiohalomonadaceae bacterium]
MQARTRRRIIWTGVLAIIVAGLVWGYWPRARPVEAAQVRRAPLQVTVDEEGRTRVIDRFVISAPVAGYARRIELKVGDAVARAAPLVWIEPPRADVLDPRTRAAAEARVAAAEAALRRSRQQARAAASEADFARRELQRIRQLAETNLVSREAEDQARVRQQTAEAAERSAEFAVEVARHDLEAARTALRYADPSTAPAGEPIAVSSPVDGSVLRVLRESEGLVGAGQALIEVGDPAALEVVVDVLSSDAVRIAPGMRVLFERWGSGAAVEGRVRRVEPVGFTKISALGVEEQRVNVIADFTSPRAQWERLGDGYRVEARFIVWEADDVLQIPTSTLFRADGAWAVFVIEDGRAQRRNVTIGQRGGVQVQVLSGLEQGEVVITHPDNTLADGVAVAITRQ